MPPPRKNKPGQLLVLGFRDEPVVGEGRHEAVMREAVVLAVLA